MQTHVAKLTTLIANRYELEGSGEDLGAVTLYKALDVKLQRPVTLQILSRANFDGAGDGTGAAAARDFLRHQQVASSIHNCDTLQVYDAVTWDGCLYSVMERDRGLPPATLYRPDYIPDADSVLRVLLGTAQTLSCCRQQGLHDWVFSPDAVRISEQGTPHIAIIEGLSGNASSAGAGTDAAALAALFRLMLSGNPYASEAQLTAALVPPSLLTLAKEIDPAQNKQMATAADVVARINAAVQSSLEPTQAYAVAGPTSTP